jgi:pimeloyl-ACP methyl ester carboxylesterase
MIGELVHTSTKDHVRLHGFYQKSNTPSRSTPDAGNVDAAILIHGLGGNFYSSRLLNFFSGAMLELGISPVVVNTRGHDMINTSTSAGRSRSLGAAFENVSESTFDLNAWTDFMLERGHQNILWLGHSLGAIKSLYTQANAPHDSVTSIVALSATRLSHKRLVTGPGGGAFQETMKRCQELVDQKQGDTPIQVPVPFPTWMTPSGYLEKYGPSEKYNWLTFIDKVDIPTLLVFGEKELDENHAFEGLREELEVIQNSWSCPTVVEIPEADHFYSAKYEEANDVIARWLCR